MSPSIALPLLFILTKKTPEPPSSTIHASFFYKLPALFSPQLQHIIRIPDRQQSPLRQSVRLSFFQSLVIVEGAV